MVFATVVVAVMVEGAPRTTISYPGTAELGYGGVYNRQLAGKPGQPNQSAEPARKRPDSWEWYQTGARETP